MSAANLQLDLDAPSPPYGYNTSAWPQRIPICVLASAGFVAATYMALYQWGLIESAWDPVFGGQTEQVLRSETSKTMERWLRVPDAALGAAAYLGDSIYGLAGSTRRWQLRPWMTILFGLDVIPLGIVSVVLVVLQGTVVGAWCFLCLLTAGISLALVFFAYDEVWACLKFLRHVWRSSPNRRLFWEVFWGKGSPEAARLALHASAQEAPLVAASR
jgi:uncharacterized membrane protein